MKLIFLIIPNLILVFSKLEIKQIINGKTDLDLCIEKLSDLLQKEGQIAYSEKSSEVVESFSKRMSGVKRIYKLPENLFVNYISLENDFSFYETPINIILTENLIIFKVNNVFLNKLFHSDFKNKYIVIYTGKEFKFAVKDQIKFRTILLLKTGEIYADFNGMVLFGNCYEKNISDKIKNYFNLLPKDINKDINVPVYYPCMVNLGNCGYFMNILNTLNFVDFAVSFNLGRTAPMITYHKSSYYAGYWSSTCYPFQLANWVVQVPLAKQIRPGFAPLYTFEKEVWGFLFISIIISIIFTLFIKYFNKNFKGKHLIFDIISIVLQQAIQQPKYIILRWVFALFSAVFLILTTAFSGHFFSLIMNPLHEKQINSIQDIVEENYRITYDDPLARELLDSDDVFYNLAQDNMCYISECRNSHNLVYLKSLDSYELSVLRRKYYHIHLGMDFHYFHVESLYHLKYLLEHYMFMAATGGLLEKWYKDSFYKRQNTTVDSFKQISLDHLFLMFYIYIFAISFCIICFIAEIVIYKYAGDFKIFTI